MIYNDNNQMVEKEYSIEELNEQVNLMMEAGLIAKISNGAKRLLTKGKAIFSRRKRKVLDKNTGEEIEDVKKTNAKEKTS